MNFQSSSTNNVQNNPPSRIVYLGSIPYDQTEQQILDLCSNVGPVINLKMMFDPQTGKSKGYAFIEFKDLESSASAIRNLNGYQLGSRFLKCGYSSNNDISSLGGNGTNISNSNEGESNMNGSDGNDGNNSLRFLDLPTGIDVNINMTTPAMMISSEISKLDKKKQLEILKKFQSWSRKNSDLSKTLFAEYPQLTYAIAELLLTNGICKVDDLTQLASNNDSDNSNKNNNIDQGDGTDNRLADDPETRAKQKDLLKQLLQLNDSEISILPDNEKMALWDLKQRAMKGEFGMI